MARLGRPRGSKNPERIKSARLQECLTILRELDADEAAVVRAVATEQVARASEFSDRPAALRDQWILALSEADLRKREAALSAGETPSGLRLVREYEQFKPDWGPAVSSLYREFKGWKDALAAGGLLDVLQPQTHIGIVDGRPKGNAGVTWTEEDYLRTLALCYEQMRGRRFSWDAFAEFRRSTTRKLPPIPNLSQKRSGRSWQQWLDEAADYIVAQPPAAYPVAYDFITRSRATESNEAAG